jgi:hypothetical protein
MWRIVHAIVASPSQRIKIISLIVRRPDLDRAASAQHSDQRHAVLALRLLPVPFAAYRRNRVVWPDDSPFDCVSEFCFPNADAAKQIFELLASDAGQPLHEDEKCFMDRARNAFYVVGEEVTRTRAVESSGGSVGIWALSAAECRARRRHRVHPQSRARPPATTRRPGPY